MNFNVIHCVSVRFIIQGEHLFPGSKEPGFLYIHNENKVGTSRQAAGIIAEVFFKE
jgi:hypothetical protein